MSDPVDLNYLENKAVKDYQKSHGDKPLGFQEISRIQSQAAHEYANMSPAEQAKVHQERLAHDRGLAAAQQTVTDQFGTPQFKAGETVTVKGRDMSSHTPSNPLDASTYNQKPADLGMKEGAYDRDADRRTDPGHSNDARVNPDNPQIDNSNKEIDAKDR